jgi:glutaredoxin
LLHYGGWTTESDNLDWRQRLEVKIYTKPGCPYCAKARDFYNERGIPFKEFNAQDNMKFREEMLSISKGDPTVPVIVEDGKLKQIGWEGRG